MHILCVGCYERSLRSNVLFSGLIGKPLRYCIGCGANRCTR